MLSLGPMMRSTEHARDKAPFAVPSVSIMDANTMTFSGTFSKSFNSESEASISHVGIRESVGFNRKLFFDLFLLLVLLFVLFLFSSTM
jgi:hypothetical protein